MKFDAPRADELPLVYDAWATSFRKSPFAGCVLNRDWDAVSRATIGELVDRSKVIVCVQELDEDPNGARRVIGYSVSEPRRACLHWLYVKRDYRALGYGRRLLAHTVGGASDGWVYTHRTHASSKFLGPGFKWDPVHARVKRT